MASLAPTVKNTIAGGEYTVQYRGDKCSCPKLECSSKIFSWSSPFEALSDRKYFEVKRLNFFQQILFASTVEHPNYWKDAQDQIENPGPYEKIDEEIKNEKLTIKNNDRERLYQLIKCKGLNLNAEVQYSLYKKIVEIHEYTEMDAFECSMTVLMDEIMRLFENGLGFGSDEGSAIASAAIDRWNAIYGTWGTLSSLKTFSEPIIVNIFRAVLIGIYAWFMPKSYLKYHDVIDEGWLYAFVAGDMFIFCLMWWLAFAVRNPFKNSFIIRNVSHTAYQTQYQVQQLMANRVEFDTADYMSNSKYGYIRTNGGGDENRTVGFNIFTEDDRPIEDILVDSLRKRDKSTKDNQKAIEDILVDSLRKRDKSTKDNQNKLNIIIKNALEELNKEAVTRDNGLIEMIRKIVDELAKQPPPPPKKPPPKTSSEDKPSDTAEANGLRRRGLNF